MLADLRRKASTTLPVQRENISTFKQESATKATLAPSVSIPRIANRNVSTIDYSYLQNDLIKTIILTSAIAVTELVIKFLVKI